MSDEGNIFDLYADKTGQKSKPQEDRRDYKAFGLDKSRDRQTRLMVHYKNGVIEVITYSHLTNVLCTSSQYISLICSNCVLTLEGRNLLAPVVEGINVMELLQDEKIRYIRCFNGAELPEPPDNEPVINNIQRLSLAEWDKAQSGED